MLILCALAIPTKPTMGGCSAETEPYAEMLALLLSDDESKSDMARGLPGFLPIHYHHGQFKPSFYKCVSFWFTGI